MLILLVGALIVIAISLCTQVGGLILAGRIVKAEHLRFRQAIRISLLWLALAAVVAAAGQAIEIFLGEVLLAGLCWLLLLVLWVAGTIWSLKSVLHLRFGRAVLVTLVGLTLGWMLQAMLTVPVRLWIASPYKFPSGSMQPSLHEGDRLLTNKLSYKLRDPRRWEVAVFRFPEDPRRPFLKRVVGLPGETIEIRDGAVWIDGKKVEPPQVLTGIEWLSAGRYATANQPYSIPRDCYFVLGDNGASSHDSRYWGCVPRGNFVGKAFYIFWPPSHIGQVP